MKSIKQFMAVFMTAVFLAASFPVTLSAADRRENASMVSAGSSTDTAADTDQQAETETVTEDSSGGFGPDQKYLRRQRKKQGKRQLQKRIPGWKPGQRIPVLRKIRPELKGTPLQRTCLHLP